MIYKLKAQGTTSHPPGGRKQTPHNTKVSVNTHSDARGTCTRGSVTHKADPRALQGCATLHGHQKCPQQPICTISKGWKSPTCPAVKHKLWLIHKTKYYAAVKINTAICFNVNESQKECGAKIQSAEYILCNPISTKYRHRQK